MRTCWGGLVGKKPKSQYVSKTERLERASVLKSMRTSTPDKQEQFKGHDDSRKTHYTVHILAATKRNPHTHTHTPERWSHLLTHSWHERTDRFLTRIFNSNHINPPLGTVGMSTRQAFSQPLCCSGSVLVYREHLWGSWGGMGNEWMTARLPKMTHCVSACPLPKMPGCVRHMRAPYSKSRPVLHCVFWTCTNDCPPSKTDSSSCLSECRNMKHF